ncbi:type II secretion system protein GspD, partial [Yersinia enterocolitica]|nr:type II secretion system protein GspD [Yersinia enterocolitica]
SNLILFIRPTILRDTSDYSQVTVDKYAEYNNIHSINSSMERPIDIVSDRISYDAFNTLKSDIIKFYEMVEIKI